MDKLDQSSDAAWNPLDPSDGTDSPSEDGTGSSSDTNATAIQTNARIEWEDSKDDAAMKDDSETKTMDQNSDESGSSAAPTMQGASMSTSNIALGKGLDIGTANIVSAKQNEQSGVTIHMERNAFIDITSDVHSKRMLTQLNVPYVLHNNKLVILGDAAFELSNIFGREMRRPMKDGLISPSEVDALPMIRLIIEKVLGEPQGDGEPVYFSVPAPSVDRQNNIIYHQGLFEGMLRKLGYAPNAMNEGHAVVLAELQEQDFTGIGISCGGGMVNVCVCYKTIPAISFSISRAGDWIDQNVGNVLGVSATKAAFLKEQGVDLASPRNREDEAIVIYYRNLINYILENIRMKFETSADIPEFRNPVEIVCSGGTSMIEGFETVFGEELEKVQFPLKVSLVRRASDPLQSVAKGCLIAAAMSQSDQTT